jgi:hypothetical protein
MADATGVTEISKGARLTMFGGAGALVLAILGLVGILPFYMLGIATICVGGALIMEGGAVSARMGDAVRQATAGKADLSDLGGGITVEFLGGAAGVALGIGRPGRHSFGNTCSVRARDTYVRGDAVLRICRSFERPCHRLQSNLQGILSFCQS